MFTINHSEELSVELLHKMFTKFQTTVAPRLLKYKNYYDGAQAILSKCYTDKSKPCNRTTTNYCKNITDAYCGYIASPGYISYHSDTDIEDIMNVLRYNDSQAEDSYLLLDALIYGVGAELMYIDNESKTRFRTISPQQCFGIFDDCLTNDLLYFVRFYPQSQWSDTNTYNVDVYSDTEIKHYTMTGMGGALTLTGVERHYFNQCPANIFYMPDEKSIFDCIMSLQDSYNELLTSEIDDYSAFVDAFLTLTGVDAETDDIAQMKENRVLVLPEGAQANWLTKNANDAQVENILKRLHDSIYRIAQCPDFSNDVFNSAQSGIAIRFKLTNMECRASKIVALMKKALQRRIEIICGIASLKLGEEVYRDIDIVFKRNIPNDDNVVIQTVNSLRGLVSDETLLSMVPQIENPVEEIEKVKKQRETQMSLYNFGDGGGDEQ